MLCHSNLCVVKSEKRTEKNEKTAITNLNAIVLYANQNYLCTSPNICMSAAKAYFFSMLYTLDKSRTINSPLCLSLSQVARDYVIGPLQKCSSIRESERSANKILRKYSTVIFFSFFCWCFIGCLLAAFSAEILLYHMHFNMSREFRIKSQFFFHFYLFTDKFP